MRHKWLMADGRWLAAGRRWLAPALALLVVVAIYFLSRNHGVLDA